MYSSSFTDLPNASSVGSLNHATPLELREEECCLYPQHEHISRVSFLCVSLCVCLHACTQQFTDHQHRTHLLASQGALTKQLSVLPLSKHVSHTCLTSSSSTCVFHTHVVTSPENGSCQPVGPQRAGGSARADATKEQCSCSRFWTTSTRQHSCSTSRWCTGECWGCLRSR